ncbi:TPA: hypothetical protein ACKRY8_002623 [Proteus mirabilis]|uniref:hypothetical protein n=1 Tax=Proteus mirabilis TaxID=584 RepID=UPI001BA58E60|nr:hypothetical protein [Proteus mirabilis]
MDKSRRQFEEWFAPQKEEMKRNGLGMMHITRMYRRQLSAWQASRESAEPEIKHHQLRELVNTARDTAIKYQGCQCLRSALETSIRNSLTSNGVKIKNE